VTEENLINAGFQNWDKLILRWVWRPFVTASTETLIGMYVL
jgi:hypothetical protein